MAPGAPGGQQPQQWMARPEAIPGCPPGLEYLTQIDQLLVHQQIELLEGTSILSHRTLQPLSRATCITVYSSCVIWLTVLSHYL